MPVAAALGRQVEVDDLGKLLLQDRHEHLVQRHAEHRRLVGRLAGVGGVVDRVAAVRQALDLEHREPVLLVVIAGVVAERAFERVQVAADAPCSRTPCSLAPGEARCGDRDVAFEHELGAGRHLQHHAARRRRSRSPRCGCRAAGRRTGTPTACRAPASRRPGSSPGRRPAPPRSGTAGPDLASAKSRKSSAPPRCASQRMITWRRPITCWR